ncbi:putative glucose oxidase [Aspergillus pseudotamarii]|uniref:glucose oxidase n=1 Tax=Aspergillus pseudotamarii TaxID=132259 RepID=A0A5N6T958_ASPPS|nr:putative glucose oxidase [Aspergillus pseudotamarii]KAE8142842.1 putative glucose oxidase [Aspergillus pseudotamarii]
MLLFWILSLVVGIIASDSSDYDYIIVGGGTSGLAVANRLAEDPNVSVLVIEAGSSVFDNVNVTDISNLPYTYDSPLDWAYETTEQSFGKRRQVMRAGKALGGTSVMNGAAYVRAEKAQIDALREIGIEGWDWDNLFPYYTKSENMTTPNQTQIEAGASICPAYHGTSGPVHVGFMDIRKDEGDLTASMNRTLEALGIPWNRDLNSGHMRGFALHPYTVDVMNIRSDAARAYYWPYAERPNLRVELNTFVARIIWDNEKDSDIRAQGVEIFTQEGGGRRINVVNARREVIMAAGAMRTPAILELSGVGNPRILEKYGIPVRVNLPSVGENLQDQLNTSIVVSTNTPVTGTRTVAFASASDIFGSSVQSVAASVRSQLDEYADIASSGSNGAMRKEDLLRMFEIQHDLVFAQDIPVAEYVFILENANTIHTGYWGLLPFARGNVHISSADPMAPPVVNPNFGLFEWDVQIQIAMSKFLRQMYKTGELKSLVGNESLPGFKEVPQDASDEAWTKWIGEQYTPNYHVIGTTSMLPRSMGGVVDSRLKVYGTSNVRVVDSSIQPMQIGGHPTANLYAIAERVSEMIKEDATATTKI